MEQPARRVMVLGLRGFPNVQGGVESHCEQLLPLLVQRGWKIEAIVRSPYVPPEWGLYWNGVRYRRLPAPRWKILETMMHTFLGVLYAGLKRPDILHVHAVGPSLMVPVARLLGLRVVMTHHGADYSREKWGGLAKTILRKGEACGVRYAQSCIAISQAIADSVMEKHGIKTTLIPNGVKLPRLPYGQATLRSFHLNAGKYVLLVGRLVPEKRHLDLIEAFKRAAIPGWKLVLVGASDHPDQYARTVHEAAQNTLDVVMTGFQTGEALRELYAHAGIFVLPSSHEGLPIALLEALSYGVDVLVSDIPANLEVGLDCSRYFRLGAIDELAEKMSSRAVTRADAAERHKTREWVAERYNWTNVAERTLQVYQITLLRNA